MKKIFHTAVFFFALQKSSYNIFFNLFALTLKTTLSIIDNFYGCIKKTKNHLLKPNQSLWFTSANFRFFWNLECLSSLCFFFWSYVHLTTKFWLDEKFSE